MNHLKSLFFLLLFVFCCSVLAEDNCTDLLTEKPARIVITDKAMKHIWEGDFGQSAGGKHVVLKGGLHSLSALEKFLAIRLDLFFLGNRRINLYAGAKESSDIHWYHYTVNQANGVIHVRLPPAAFHKKSLNALLQADIQAQGGYLWKTIFPEDLSKEELREQIEYLFERSTEVQDRGWAYLIEGIVPRRSGEEGFRLKVVFNKKTGDLISAYPSFMQKRGVFGPTAIGKSINITDMAPMVESLRVENKDKSIDESGLISFSDIVMKIVNLKIHDQESWRKKNFKAWNRMSIREKMFLLGLFHAESNHVNGSVNMLELIAQGVVDGYDKESLTKKMFEMIEAIVQDPEISVNRRLDLLLDLIVNQRVVGIHIIEDIIFGKFLLAKAYGLIRKVDIGYQAYAIRMIEKSSIHFLNLIYFAPKTFRGSDLHILSGKVTTAISLQTGLNDDYYHGDQAPMAFYFDYARQVEGMEWEFFAIQSDIELSQPGFFSSNFLRMKFFTDYLNTLTINAGTSELLWRHQYPKVSIYGQLISERDLRLKNSRRAILKSIKKHRRLIQSLLFESRSHFNKWYKFLTAATSFDVEAVKVIADQSDYSFEPEVYEMLYEARLEGAGPMTVIFPELQLVRLKEESVVDVRQKLRFIEYKF